MKVALSELRPVSSSIKELKLSNEPEWWRCDLETKSWSGLWQSEAGACYSALGVNVCDFAEHFTRLFRGSNELTVVVNFSSYLDGYWQLKQGYLKNDSSCWNSEVINRLIQMVCLMNYMHSCSICLATSWQTSTATISKRGKFLVLLAVECVCMCGCGKHYWGRMPTIGML